MKHIVLSNKERNILLVGFKYKVIKVTPQLKKAKRIMNDFPSLESLFKREKEPWQKTTLEVYKTITVIGILAFATTLFLAIFS